MNRRALYGLVILVVTFGVCAESNAATKTAHVGFLRAEAPDAVLEHLRDGMRDLGYIEGRNLVIEQRYARGNYSALPRLAQELVDLKVDVIFATCHLCARAALLATRTIPIVTVSGDPLRMGLVASLSRPGGNVTGLTLALGEVSIKRLELLRQLAPRIARVAVVSIAENPLWDGIIEGMKQAAPTLGMDTELLRLTGPGQIDEALDSVVGRRADALVVLEDPVLRDNAAHFIEFARKRGIPAIYGEAQFVRNGGLISYGASYPDLVRRAARYVVQILDGANPAELPMQQPTRFELAVNLKTAKALGLKVPESILLLATEVIR